MAVIANYGLPQGLAGATAAASFAGATVSGAPVSGTYEVGDLTIDQSGSIWICTVAGSPGTFVELTNIITGTGSTLGNEGRAAVLTNATSPGALGNRSDHFLAGIGPKWTQDSVNGAQAGDSAAWVSTAGTTETYYEAYTPSGSFDIHARVTCGSGVQSNGTISSVLVGLTDSGGLSGNGMFMALSNSTGALQFRQVSLDSGVFNIRNTAGIQNATGGATQGWTYIRLEGNGSSQTALWAYDRFTWVIPLTFAKSFTPARLYFSFPGSSGDGEGASIDFIDVVA